MQNLKRFDEAVADWKEASEFATKKENHILKKPRLRCRQSQTAKQKKKSKSKKQTGIKKKKSDENRDKPLVAPRPKLAVLKPKG